MKKHALLRLVVLLLCAAAMTAAYQVTKTKTLMAESATLLVESLNRVQKSYTVFPFASSHRNEWHYFPEGGFTAEYGYVRNGITFNQMDPKQAHFANALLAFRTSFRMPLRGNRAPASFRFARIGRNLAVANGAATVAFDDMEAQAFKKTIGFRAAVKSVRTQKLARGGLMGQCDRIFRRQMSGIRHQTVAPTSPSRRYPNTVDAPDGLGNVGPGNDRGNHDFPDCPCSII